MLTEQEYPKEVRLLLKRQPFLERKGLLINMNEVKILTEKATNEKSKIDI